MSGIDIGIAVGVLISAVFGLARGFTREILSLVSWFGAGVATFIALPFAQNIARQQIANPMIADVVTAVIVFILFLIIFSLISHFFSSLVRQSALGGIDRSLGFGFGIVRGIILICLVEIAIGCFVTRASQPSSIKNSRFSSLIYQGSDFLFPFIPSSLQEIILQQRQRRASERDVLSPTINEAVGAILQNQLQQESISLSAKDNPHLELQKTAEKLARLKPQAPEPHDSNSTYSKKQRQDMERLLLQEELE